MRDEWQKVPMSDLIEEISMGPFGSDVKVSNFVENGIPVLNGSNLEGFRLKEESFRYFTEEKANSLGKANAYRGDVVVTHRGTIGQIVYIPECSKFDRYVISQSQFRFRCGKRLIPEFVVYFFHTVVGQSLLLSNASQVGVPALARATSTFKQLKIPLPPLATQKKIAAVLGALDDKIELNRKMNANLEAQAQALFKSWFVDFEPFGGKMPEGWKKGRFADLIGEMFNGDWGKDEPEKNNQAPVYCIRGADIPNVRMGEIGKMPLRYILPKNLNKKKLVDHDLVVEIAGGSPTQSTGRVAIVRNLLLSKYPHDLICTNFCKAVRPRENFGIYLYLAWTHAYNLKHYFQYENGTTGIKNLDISALIDNEEIVVPDTETVDDFNAIVGKYFDLIYCNSSESRKLAETRDALLPKLMKGEVEVDDE